MKKTFTINLGGIPFIIDEDAYQLLHNYLENIKQKFFSSDEANEIMQDIEARFAELFSEYLKGKKEVIGVVEVEAATAAMGKPEEIAGDSADTASEQTNTKTNTTASNAYKVKRKLFRNPDDKVLGGVLSGLSIYLGIDDSIWFRLLFVALFFLGLGSTFFIYILLWIIVPEAKTASDKLQMRGEPVNLESIQKEVTDAATRITRWGKEESVGERILHVLLVLIKAVFKVVAVFIALIVMFVLFVFIASSIGFMSFASIPSVKELAAVYAENSTVVYTAMIGLFLVVVMPLVSILYAAMRLVMGVKTRIPAIRWILSGGFVMGILLLVFSAISFGVNFKSKASYTEKFQIMQPANGALFVQLADSSGVVFEESDEYEEEDVFPVMINGESAKTKTGYKIGKPHIKLMPSKDDNFYVERYITSKGKTKSVALNNAKNVNYNFTQTDTVLNLNTYLEVKHGGKWRDQKLHFRLAIPEGKIVRFADNIDYLPATVKDNDEYNSTMFANTSWTVKNGKVVCLDCKGEEEWDTENIHEDEEGNVVTTKKKEVIINSDDNSGNGNVTIESTEKNGKKEVKIVVKEKK